MAGLSNDLAVALTVPSLRIEAPIPGKPYVGVEIPNPKRRGISIRTILESQIFQDNEYDLPLPMGVRVDSRPLVGVSRIFLIFLWQERRVREKASS